MSNNAYDQINLSYYNNVYKTNLMQILNLSIFQ